MQKYAITSLIMATIAIPAMATNDLVTETNNGCDNTTLNTYDGDVNLTADWSANTINLTWYNDSAENGGEVHSNTQCTYNSGITLPTAPTRNGYTFGGWRVRQCSLSLYLPENNGIGYGYINDMEHTVSPEANNDEAYGLTEYNTWAVQFSEGVLKGRAICTEVAPSNWDSVMNDLNNGIITEEQAVLMLWGNNGIGVMPYNTFSSDSTGQYCWCAGTDFDNLCHVVSPSWFFYNDDRDPDHCAYRCAFYCARSVNDSAAFRRIIFGMPTE